MGANTFNELRYGVQHSGDTTPHREFEDFKLNGTVNGLPARFTVELPARGVYRWSADGGSSPLAASPLGPMADAVPWEAPVRRLADSAAAAGGMGIRIRARARTLGGSPMRGAFLALSYAQAELRGD